jgi:hypothetical protein
MNVHMRRIAWAFLVTVVCARCGGEQPVAVEPHAGELSVNLVSPRDDDWGFVFRITTTPPRSIVELRATCNCVLHVRTISETEVRGLLGGFFGESDEFLRARVSDVTTPSEYHFTLIEVADRSGELRSDLSGYELAVAN